MSDANKDVLNNQKSILANQKKILANQSAIEKNQSKLENRLDEVARTAQKTNRETTALASLRTQKANSVKAIQSQRQEFAAAAALLDRTAVIGSARIGRWWPSLLVRRLDHLELAVRT